MTVDFLSDPEGAPPQFPPQGVPVLVENGQPQLLNPFFVPLLPPANIEMRAASDIEPVTPVRPSTWGKLKGVYR